VARFVSTAFGGNKSPGVHGVPWIIAIVIAAVLVIIACTAAGRNTARRRG
jgi:hypothetical protein